MLKRSISIGLILIMAFAMASPILHIDCDMPCCEVKKETCCENKKAMNSNKSCSMSEAKCKHSQFIPVISAPKSDQKSAQVDMTKTTCTMKMDAPKCQRSQKTVSLDRSSDSQAKFSIPLRL
ncbi:MAG: hypothetical protein HOA15_08540 [Candidatus Marinimicrobia bacterium]|jgi:hypothetical protein|nr:hypothetical protein [Candidatus Neomarinimicrobiota bacterium]MBT3675556.1 hypothetical protein [Candidatus Neomarinimicrobiota bacterium]MBT3762485.1 hypothetical protein [Candidatus Neomarinimicrobiota bacterium]MBT4067634.1 hypothetical protein [Candidatus Neomarinimicrobiota bacterium]MBT4271414.1 hypothetical protein [Candidatus Neomarinimicrobiota bacterium]